MPKSHVIHETLALRSPLESFTSLRDHDASIKHTNLKFEQRFGRQQPPRPRLVRNLTIQFEMEHRGGIRRLATSLAATMSGQRVAAGPECIQDTNLKHSQKIFSQHYVAAASIISCHTDNRCMLHILATMWLK